VYQGQNLELIGIDPGGQGGLGGDTTEILQQFIDQTGVTFPMGIDVEMTYDQFVAAEDGISPYPLDVIIAPDGTIAYLAREYDNAAMRAVIDGLLAP
jgi:hypothetical protein